MPTGIRVILAAAVSLVLTSLACQVDVAGQEDFRNIVLGILTEQWPSENFVAGEDPMVIVWGPYQLGLTNLEARLSDVDPASASFRQTVIEHFEALVEQAELRGAEPADIPWERASEIVRIQWVPTEYGPVLRRPFSGHISVGAVLDLGMSVVYVRPEDLDRWPVTEEALFDQAIQNLEVLSRDVEIRAEAAGGDDAVGSYLAVAEGDSYDAARLLLPEFRKRIADELGEPFLAAVPNRDFLVCWSTEYSHRAAFAERVEQDFHTRPYPLSPEVYLTFVDRIEPTAIR